MRLFVDTSAFLSLEDLGDNRHSQARMFYDALTASDRLFTSNYVTDETTTRLRYTIGHGAAVRFADAIMATRVFEVLYIDRERERAALAVLKKYRDKRLSFTDCSTISLVEEFALDAVFAFDEDFAQVGLSVLPAK